jgi:hypothetical protein
MGVVKFIVALLKDRESILNLLREKGKIDGETIKTR